MKQIKRLFEIDPWKIRTTKLDRENRRLQESLTSIGNGYMGMRGNFEETYSADHHQGTYIAGVWFPDKTRVVGDFLYLILLCEFSMDQFQIIV